LILFDSSETVSVRSEVKLKHHRNISTKSNNDRLKSAAVDVVLNHRVELTLAY